MLWEGMWRMRSFNSASHGFPSVDDRRVISGIIFVIRDGLRWWAVFQNGLFQRLDTRISRQRVGHAPG